jgi:hypothetical protein
MPGSDKVLINLATGMEDGERVLVAFLVATAAQQHGKDVVVWATKDAVRLGIQGKMHGVVCKDCPPLERLCERFDRRVRDVGELRRVTEILGRSRSPFSAMWRPRRTRQ